MKLLYKILNSFIYKNPIPRKLSLKLSLIYIAAITVPVILYFFISYYLMSTKDNKAYFQYRENMSVQLISSIEENMLRLKRQSASISLNREDIVYIMNMPLNKIDFKYLEVKDRVDKYFFSIMDFNYSIDGITLLGPEGTVVYSLNRESTTSSKLSFKDDIWYKDTLKMKGFPYFIEPHQNCFMISTSPDPNDFVVSVASAIQKINDPNWNIGVIILDQKISQLQDMMANFTLSEADSLFILGKDNYPLFSKGIQVPINGTDIKLHLEKGQNSSFKFVNNNKTYLANLSVSKALGWKVLSVIPLEALQSKNNFLKNTTALLLLALLLFIYLISLIVANFFTKPLQRLKKAFASLERGNFNIRVPVSGQDEMSDISKSFNSMALNINQLIEQKYEANILYKQAQLESLQSQINPHFLFNTLNSIKSISDSSGNDKASNMIQELSDLFRYSLSKGNYLIEFREEIESIRQYISLQSIRFEDRIDFSIDISDDVLGLDTVRMTLQPIVENAIIHGLEPSLNKGCIHISAIALETQFVIYVSDNGIGIEAAQLREINSQLETYHESFFNTHPEKVGIFNVNSRIRLCFGNQYGISIYSVPNVNTTVKITLPVKNNKPGDGLK